MDVEFDKFLDNLTNCPIIDGDNYTVIVTDNQLDAPGPVILFVVGDVAGLTGYSAIELLGKTPRILQGAETNPATLKSLREACERGDYFEGSMINYRKDGTPFVMGLVISPIIVNSNIQYYLAVQSDVTGKEVDSIMPVLNARLDRINKAFDSFGFKLSCSLSQIGKLLNALANCSNSDDHDHKAPEFTNKPELTNKSEINRNICDG